MFIICSDHIIPILYDSRVMTLREHNRWVVKVHLQKGVEGKIVTAR